MGTLFLSKGDSFGSWRVQQMNLQPQVYLSIFSTVMNALMGYALVEGITIYFWREAGRGTTVGSPSLLRLGAMKLICRQLQSLHDNYESMALNSVVMTVFRGRWSVIAFSESCVLGPNVEIHSVDSTYSRSSKELLFGAAMPKIGIFVPSRTDIYPVRIRSRHHLGDGIHNTWPIVPARIDRWRSFSAIDRVRQYFRRNGFATHVLDPTGSARTPADYR